MCVSPYIIKDKSGHYVPVPCGKCFECLQEWSRDWKFRLHHERNKCAASVHVTLTYDPKYLPVKFNNDAGEWQSYLEKAELQKFLKRVRFNCPQLKFRYFAIGEYGGDFNRAHYHILFFFYHTAGFTLNKLWNYLYWNWKKGFVYVKPTENRHLNYMSKYFNKVDKSPHIVEPFKCMSKSLGLCFLTDRMKDYFFKSLSTSISNPWNGKYVKLPRYYKKKLDEYSCEYLKDGRSWSDLVRERPFEPKGLGKYFDYFCKNVDSILLDYLHKRIPDLPDIMAERNWKYHRKVVLYNHIYSLFCLWCLTVPDIINARDAAARRLKAALVQHKYTKLKEIEILYNSA